MCGYISLYHVMYGTFWSIQLQHYLWPWCSEPLLRENIMPTIALLKSLFMWSIRYTGQHILTNQNRESDSTVMEYSI